MFNKNGLFLFVLVLCSFFSVSALAETKYITGYVKDENGNGVKGVSVTASNDACNGDDYYYRSSSPSQDDGYFKIVLDYDDGSVPNQMYLNTNSPEDSYYYITYKNGNQGSAYCSDATPLEIPKDRDGVDNVIVPINKGGRISGKVFDENNGLLEGVNVLFSTGCPESVHIVSVANTGADGAYSAVVPAGNIIAYVVPSYQNLPYLTQFWNNTLGGGNSCGDSTPVSIIKNQEISNVNFNLIKGGTIEGKIRDSLYQPVQNVLIYFSTDKCGNEYIAETTTDENGYYIKKGLPINKKIYVNSRSKGVNPYFIDKVWNSAGCERNCQRGEGITLSTGEIKSNVNLTLGLGGIISGTVKDSFGNPVEGVIVQAYSEKSCNSANGEWLSDSISDSKGNFKVQSVPSGEVFLSAVVTSERVKNSKYLKTSYWNGKNGTSICNDTIPFDVEGDTTYSNINFVLDVIGVVKGKVVSSSGAGVNGLSVQAYVNKCDLNPVYSSYTSGSGDFVFDEVQGLNSLFVRIIDPNATPLWIGGWYNDYAKVTEQCRESDPIKVSIGEANVSYPIYVESVKEYSYKILRNAKSISAKAVKQSKKSKLKAKKAKSMGNEIQVYLDDLINHRIQVTKVSNIKKQVKTAMKKNKLKQWKKVDNSIKKLLNSK